MNLAFFPLGTILSILLSLQAHHYWGVCAFFFCLFVSRNTYAPKFLAASFLFIIFMLNVYFVCHVQFPFSLTPLHSLVLPLDLFSPCYPCCGCYTPHCSSFVSTITPSYSLSDCAPYLHNTLRCNWQYSSECFTSCLFCWMPHNSQFDWHEQNTSDILENWWKSLSIYLFRIRNINKLQINIWITIIYQYECWLNRAE